jgi:hypothetical protein
MPEALIIHRMKYKENITAEWWNMWTMLTDEQREVAKPIIFAYNFSDSVIASIDDANVRAVLRYYQIRRGK